MDKDEIEYRQSISECTFQPKTLGSTMKSKKETDTQTLNTSTTHSVEKSVSAETHFKESLRQKAAKQSH